MHVVNEWGMANDASFSSFCSFASKDANESDLMLASFSVMINGRVHVGKVEEMAGCGKRPV